MSDSTYYRMDQGGAAISAAHPMPVTGSIAVTGGATEAKQDTQITDLGGVTETAPATDTASSGLNGRLQRIAQRITSLIAVFTAGPLTDAGSLSVVPSTSQNPIFDHTNGTKTSVTTSATIITPPTGCQFIRLSTDVDIYVNTAGSTAVDDGTSIRVVANSPEIIPVVAATAVKALSSAGTATVRCTPFKVR